MGLNKSKGQMFTFVTHTFNVIKGVCPLDCIYCYCKDMVTKPLHLDTTEFKTDLGEGNIIFVGSSIDMFAEEVPIDWIAKTLSYCRTFDKNTYLFQTKNPKRYNQFWGVMPSNVILGITIETNRDTSAISKAPSILDRVKYMSTDLSPCLLFTEKTVTIEPIMDFDLELFVEYIRQIKPKFVSIGADSKNHNLQEPSAHDVNKLIFELKKFTDVKIKSNLSRILRKGD